MDNLVFCIVLVAFTSSVHGQVPADSLREYDLEELVVSTSHSRGTFESIAILGPAALSQISPTSADAAIAYLPSARIQTNSRGETLVYFRNSGERQVAILLDGAPLNIAWDNRADLSFIPAGAIGRLALVSGPSSVLFGTNVTGGVVELISRLPTNGRTIELDAALGSIGFVQGSARYFDSLADWRFGAVLEYSERSALPLPNDTRLPFSQAQSGRRTNTDWKLGSVHLRALKSFSESLDIGFTMVGNSGEKGIAPESHLDPATSDIRFWRYPKTNRLLFIASGRVTTGAWETRPSLWTQRFSQAIDQFDDSSYLTIGATQRDVDESAGLRIVSEYSDWPGRLRIQASYLANRHIQVDEEASETKIRRSFRQDVFSIGAEYESDRSKLTSFRGGGSLDGYLAPGTNIVGADGLDWSASAGIRRRVNSNVTVRLGGARKVRFPTARESQDTGLDRFVLNADLAPETSYLAETAVEADLKTISFSAIPFIQRTFDTIDQARVIVDSVSYRQRINISGSRVFGIELLARSVSTSAIRVSTGLTLMRARGTDKSEETRLTERPDVLANTSISARLPAGFMASTDLRYVGRAYGLNEDGQLIALRRSALLDARIAHIAYLNRLRIGVQSWIRIENVFDTETIPQLGLPGPGRFFRLGVSVTL